MIRDPEIEPVSALDLKRKIDASNQDRTDLVEYIDSYFLKKYQSIVPHEQATINTESPAWAIDRLSILALKIYHMREEAYRTDASEEHLNKCRNKLNVLLEQKKDLSIAIDQLLLKDPFFVLKVHLEQKKDLSIAIDQLLEDIEAGRKYMKVYKQMKMYNDEELNPVLRGQKG